MGVRLVIAEKPSMAAAIAGALGITAKAGGVYKGKGVWITNARGHLLETVEPAKMNPAWKVWSFKTLPMIPAQWKMEPRDDAAKQAKLVLDLMKDKDVDEIVNACDAGREGQLIFDELVQHAKVKKSLLRLWTSSLTDDAILQAWKALEPHSKRQGKTDAAWCRMHADWLVGLNATRAQTLMVQSHNSLAKTQNIGRVQTPTLRILVDRELDIRNFVPRDFFKIAGMVETDKGSFKAVWFQTVDGKIKDQIETEADAQAIRARIRGKAGRIKTVNQQDVVKKPEQLFDLTTLQKEGNRKFGFTAERTLEIAQSLYEAKVLTYPRTNSRYLSAAEMTDIVPKALEMLGANGYAKEVSPILGPGKLDLGKRFVDASKIEDHHAIIPTKDAPGSLGGDERKIYDMVVRRLISAFYPDRIEAKTQIIVDIVGDTLKANGVVVKQAGWSEIDVVGSRKKGKEDEDEAEGSLPAVKEGDSALVPSPEMVRGKTTPPKNLTEADLLGAMESAGKAVEDDDLRDAMMESGLGTPATRASIIEELVRRGFAERKKTSLIATETGIRLIQGIKREILKSPELTGQWEKRLQEMDGGKYSKDAFLREIEDFVRQLVEELKGETNMNAPAGGGRFEPVAVGKCEKCSSDLIHKAWDGRHYVQCSGKDCKFSYGCNEDGSPSILCEKSGCGGPVYETKTKKRICQRCEQWQGEGGEPGKSERFAPVAVGKCEKCSSDLIHKTWDGRHYVQCSGKEKKGCRVGYDCKLDGSPLLFCEFDGCGGPVAETKSGSRICQRCDKWQNSRREGTEGGPSSSEVGACPKCKKGKLLLRKFEGRFYVKCNDEGCKTSYDTDETGKKPKGGKCKEKDCGGPMKITQSGSKVCVACGKWAEEKKK